MSDYFSHIDTVERVKKQFAELAAEHHPEVGGSAEIFKEIYSQYLSKLKALDRQESIDSQNKVHTYYFDGVSEQAIADKLGALLALKMSETKIALVGKWLWIRGETRAHKDKLKALGCRWSGDKNAWYYHTGYYRKRSAHSSTFEGICRKYGYREFAEVK